MRVPTRRSEHQRPLNGQTTKKTRGLNNKTKQHLKTKRNKIAATNSSLPMGVKAIDCLTDMLARSESETCTQLNAKIAE